MIVELIAGLFAMTIKGAFTAFVANSKGYSKTNWFHLCCAFSFISLLAIIGVAPKAPE